MVWVLGAFLLPSYLHMMLGELPFFLINMEGRCLVDFFGGVKPAEFEMNYWWYFLSVKGAGIDCFDRQFG